MCRSSIFYLIINICLLISDKYVLKAANELCSSTGVIDNLDECISSIGYLKQHGVEVDFERRESTEEWPKGCYKSVFWAYWNPHSSGNANDDAQPICKEGEYIEVITTNLLNK